MIWGLLLVFRGNCSVDGFLQFSYVDGTPQSQASPGRGEAAPDLSSLVALLHGLHSSNSPSEPSSRGGGSLQSMPPASLKGLPRSWDPRMLLLLSLSTTDSWG